MRAVNARWEGTVTQPMVAPHLSNCPAGSITSASTASSLVCPHAAYALDYWVNGLLWGLTMYLSNQSLLVILIVGIVAGWLAGRVMEGGGFGLIGDLIVGLIGAFIGDWLLPRLGIHLGSGIISLIINAFIGAVVLLL